MPYNYVIIVRGNTLEEITEQSLHFAYFYLNRSLQQHRQQELNGEFEIFAVEVLALLQKYRHVYTAPPEPPAAEDENEDRY